MSQSPAAPPDESASDIHSACVAWLTMVLNDDNNVKKLEQIQQAICEIMVHTPELGINDATAGSASAVNNPGELSDVTKTRTNLISSHSGDQLLGLVQMVPGMHNISKDLRMWSDTKGTNFARSVDARHEVKELLADFLVSHRRSNEIELVPRDKIDTFRHWLKNRTLLLDAHLKTLRTSRQCRAYWHVPTLLPKCFARVLFDCGI